MSKEENKRKIIISEGNGSCCGGAETEKPVSPCGCGSAEPETKVPSSCGPSEKETEIENKISQLRISDNFINTPAGRIPVVPSQLNGSDLIGTFMTRMNFNRMNYKIEPGLYAVGSPDENSPVMLSCNFKLSFDALRKELGGIDTWILVINTYGINVWCAAGKGTFGTDEIVSRIQKTGLNRIVKHNKVILPQLGAPGVSAHLVKKATGFKVVYGPVRASDIPEFLKQNMRADAEMRKVHFSMKDRFILLPVEITQGMKYLLGTMILFFLLSGLNASGYSINIAISQGKAAALFLLSAFVSGTVLTPLLLPYIPGRMFSLKGSIAGVAFFIFLYLLLPGFSGSGIFNISAWFFLTASISSFMAMNFTGATTYTSLSGVLKEMKISVPMQISGAALGFILWMTARFI